MFSRELCLSGHTRRFIMSMLPSDGWEMRIEHDGEIVRRTMYTDWHRVERALGTMEREVSALQAEGWQARGSASLAAAQSTNR